MATNHELFDKVAIYMLTKAYEAFPMPAQVEWADIRKEIVKDEPPDAAIIVAYIPGFLERNGYIHQFGKLPSSGTAWRFSLNDKGLVALKRPSLSDERKTTYEQLRELTAQGLWNISQGVAANVMGTILTG